MTARSERVLITGAAGEIGTALRDYLAGRYARLVLFDRRPIEGQPGETVKLGDLANPADVAEAVRDVDVVVHLAGVPREDEWEPILRANIEGCYILFEEARKAGVGRMVFASSNHVIGFHRADRVLDPSVEARPDGRYGVSKVFGEALGRLYTDKYGMSVINLRIGTYRERPRTPREHAIWISPRDMGELARCAIEAPAELRYGVFYGQSGNAARRWTDDAEPMIGYVPQDSADDYPIDLPDPGEGAGRVAEIFHGGKTCAREFVGDPERVD